MTSPLIQETVFDEKLPQMTTLLDQRQMGEIFQREFVAATGHRVEDCRITRVKYRPGKNCLVCYLLKLVEHGNGQRREQIFSLLAFSKGESTDQFSKAKLHGISTTAIGEGLFHLPDLEAVIWAFPNDRKLAGISCLTEFNQLKNTTLPEIVAKCYGIEWKIACLTSELIHYAAERSCTVRANLELVSQQTGDKQSSVIFGKTYCPGEGAIAWQLMRELWNSEPRKQGRLQIPHPLAFQPGIETIWQSGLTGKTLDEIDDDSAHPDALFETAGATVAALHQSSVPSAPPITQSELIARLGATEELISRVRPMLRERMQSLVQRLTATADEIGGRAPVTLHGDLHLKNFFVTRGGIALIDLDNLTIGDPLQDIGSFAAAMRYRGLLEGKDFRNSIERFVAAYSASAGWEITEAALSWHLVAALLYERAYRCITRLKTGRLQLLDEIVALAEQCSQGI